MRQSALHAAIFFLVTAVTIIAIHRWDEPLARACEPLSADGSRWAMPLEIATLPGNTYVALGAVVAAFIYFQWWRREWRPALACIFIFASLSASGLAADAIKFLAGRTRPSLLLRHGMHAFDLFRIEGKHTSFPSGHTALATALTVSLSCLFPRRAAMAGFLLISLDVAITRLLLSMHYLSDVIFGAYVAVVVTLWVGRQFQRTGLGLFPYGDIRFHDGGREDELRQS